MYMVTSTYVCLCVCRYVCPCPQAYPWKYISNLYQILCMLRTHGRGSVHISSAAALRSVMCDTSRTSGFVDESSRMTSYFHTRLNGPLKYKVGQKSKLLILREYVNKTEKRGGM